MYLVKQDEGFYCYGLIIYIYKTVAKIFLPDSTGDLIKVEKREELQPGDLVFPHNTFVSIYNRNNQVIHSDEGIIVGIKIINKFLTTRRIL